MYLYTFDAEYNKFIIQSIHGWIIKLENKESAPLENFGDCLLIDDDIPLDMAHSIWESRVK